MRPILVVLLSWSNTLLMLSIVVSLLDEVTVERLRITSYATVLDTEGSSQSGARPGLSAADLREFPCGRLLGIRVSADFASPGLQDARLPW